jgi:hypothetical protein
LVPPQEVPLSALLPVSEQVWLPVLQELVPLWHGFAGTQATPDVHDTQLPALHTKLVPQLVPSALLLAVHTGLPVEHEMVPV